MAGHMLRKHNQYNKAGINGIRNSQSFPNIVYNVTNMLKKE